MKINSVSRLKKITNRKFLVRVDFNVPLEKGKIKDDYKIIAGSETIKHLSAQGAKVIVVTHLGDPGSKFVSALSTAPLAARLAKVMDLKVKFVNAVVGPKVERAISQMQVGEILFLENVRFNSGELKNDKTFAKQLASLADVYVNDAFAVSHRAQASVDAVKDYLPAYAGLLLEQELQALNKIVKPKKPLVVMMGGAKIETKAALIAKLYPRVSHILLGGGLANNFFKFQKLEIGKSLCDTNSLSIIKKLLAGKTKNNKIILPVDVVVKSKNGNILAKKINAITKTDCIFDIGPETISLFAQYIKEANTIIWNGPMGKFEDPHFKNGTISLAMVIAARSKGRAYGVAGGGETVEALKMTGMMEYVDWVSTAGGAMLSYLGGALMPGLKKIVV
ncbi:MAG TPA: phosphoglycerate kinase [Candidatus Saccharimonadales bacterium]|nr:phosphoglycerate kinase [Candidatus Saccharimonadales bacterium]